MKTLLMGGQACVFYGAAEFSRDLDLLLLCEDGNLALLTNCLAELEADRIAVPELHAAHLNRGHAVHFRCRRPDVANLRIDLMSYLRGVDGFSALWDRRTVLSIEGEDVDLLSLPDLVKAKKTQRDKDWPMIRRLVEQSYFAAGIEPAHEQIEFWLRELRTPELLISAARRWPEVAASVAAVRPAAAFGAVGDPEQVATALQAEERRERVADRDYWEPLKRELEQFRRDARLPR